MFGLKKKFSLYCLGLVLSIPIWISSVNADDMEIYNMTTDATAAGDVNIVFLLDRSGSMRFCIDRNSPPSNSDPSYTDTNHTNMYCNRPEQTRMAALRNAMAEVLNSLADTTKVAIFTYGGRGSTARGGTMLAPLRALNETLPDGTTTHKQYLLDWFVARNQVGDDQYLIGNAPPNWVYNFGPSDSNDLLSDPPAGCTSTGTGAGCGRNWNTEESNLFPEDGTPLESAYAEIGSYLLGKTASTYGNTYFARSGNLAKMNLLGSGSSARWSKLDKTLNVTNTSPVVLSGSDYFYRQPNYTAQQTCAAPSWHVILVTDGEPSGDSPKSLFDTVMGDQKTCNADTTWACSKELALFLSNNALETTEYSWSCIGNCGAYTDSSGNSVTPSTTPSMTACDSPGEGGGTRTTTVGNYKAYNWTCGSTSTTNYEWVRTGTNDCGTGVTSVPTCNSSRVNTTACVRTGSGFWATDRTYTCTGTPQTSYAWNCTGGSCSDSNKPTPSTNGCNESDEVGRNSTTYGNPINSTVTWQCNVLTTADPYDNGLGVDVKTNTIFVGPDGSTSAINNMTEISNNGKGIFNKSTSVADLKKALLATVADAEKQPNTVSAPGVAVNQLSRFQHLDQLYYSVFQPNATGLWEGNLKRFLLKDNSIKDSQDVDAVDSGTKFFKDSADSCWGQTGSLSTQPAGCFGYTLNDGKDSTKGGMRSKLNASSRNMLTTTNGTTMITLESLRLADGAASSAVTTAAGHLGYSTACASSTAPYCNGDVAALGASDADRVVSINQLIDWAKGVRAPGKVAMLAADPLHSQPVLVNYGFTGDSGSGATRQAAYDEALADGSKQQNYVFFSTNGGVLHGVNANTGEEQFAFIPNEMLPLVPKTKNVPTWTGTASRIYGLDSTWVSWRRDANFDGDIKDANEWAYLYGGMRMGGSNYYALDVTNVTSPTIKWTIKGPLAGGFNTMSDSNGRVVYRPINVASIPAGPYRWMGQTWSKPVLARLALRSGSDEIGRTVLVFGGGYDPTNETQPYMSGTTTVTPTSTFGTDAYGHQLYIVDAKTGNLLFWAAGGSGTYGSGTTTSVTESPTLTVADMKYSITGSPTPVDRDGDGFTDMIYFADLGGQVFRMDFKNKGTNGGAPTTCSSSITSACSDMVMRVARIASLGEASNTGIGNQRRFFEAPGIGILQRPGGSQYMGVAIGSGNRSHPAYVGTQDRIYVFEDSTALTNNLSGVGTIAALTHSNLQDVTSYNYDATNLATFTGKSGYFFDVSATSGTNADGEKIFSSPLIFQSMVYLTSYIPETGVSTSSNQCSPGTGSSSLYVFNIFDGRSAKTDATNLLDRAIEGITSTITGDVQIVFNADGTSTILAGTYAEEAGDSNKGLRRTRWYEKPHY